MRNVINISVSDKQKKDIQKFVAQGNYNSTSEFIRVLLREWEKHHTLLEDIRTSESELASGKKKSIASLENLMKK